ncbi:trypsin-7-like [Drosophila guanche]|uniref:Blast:Serine protease persephone n=1 Tax=Drosophila guanche TaxID=7266 RepID=A0A3B0JK01_DROGU|nr:trypsin-7-like [Drosophila guanche]XP_034128450.1 trypsin-7-like [Drosophila guanche]SPP82545.1 blast:Serine protease persephone [Drosophila guanche]
MFSSCLTMLFRLVFVFLFCVLKGNQAVVHWNYTQCDSVAEKCVSYRDCINARNLQYIKVCALRAICCPIPKRRHADTPSSRACLKYSKDNTFCPSHLFVSHSNESIRNELQYMAHIAQRNPNGTYKIGDCGGTLIHNKFVLTAAHCVNRERNIGTQEEEFVVRLGGHNATDGDIYEVARKIPHPDYDGDVMNDIALVELTSKVVFNDRIKPACLPTTSGDEHDSMTVSGWGRYSATTPNAQSPVLRKADLKLFHLSECGPEALEEMHICAGGDKQTSDSCQGDSGGPLAIWHPEWGSCLGQVFGIVSHGSLCHEPSPRTKYIRVFHYLRWIEDIVWNVTSENTD